MELVSQVALVTVVSYHSLVLINWTFWIWNKW
jgi:hypothetical protein